MSLATLPMVRRRVLLAAPSAVCPAATAKGQIFRHGQVITTVLEHRIVDVLLDEAFRLTQTGDG
ncbi:hypothetical protein [Streptomyces sp. NPDC001635]|nr:hypothetical protein E4K10_45985 [Streptomyces sp. T1317-0309]